MLVKYKLYFNGGQPSYEEWLSNQTAPSKTALKNSPESINAYKEYIAANFGVHSLPKLDNATKDFHKTVEHNQLPQKLTKEEELTQSIAEAKKLPKATGAITPVVNDPVTIAAAGIPSLLTKAGGWAIVNGANRLFAYIDGIQTAAYAKEAASALSEGEFGKAAGKGILATLRSEQGIGEAKDHIANKMKNSSNPITKVSGYILGSSPITTAVVKGTQQIDKLANRVLPSKMKSDLVKQAIVPLVNATKVGGVPLTYTLQGYKGGQDASTGSAGVFRLDRPFNEGLKYKMGGIIVGGVGHNQKNNIGDYGVPVVPTFAFMKSGGKYDKTVKIAEIEDSELIFNLETAQNIEKLVDEYLECGCTGKLIALGSIVKEALKNTSDETCRTGCRFESKLKTIK